MSSNLETIELDAKTAALLNTLAQEKGVSVAALLESLSCFLPLLCALNEAGAREYPAFCQEYGKLIGAEDCFLSTMAYRDFAAEEPCAPPDSGTLLRTILGLAYLNAASAQEKESEGVTGSVVAAVAAQ